LQYTFSRFFLLFSVSFVWVSVFWISRLIPASANAHDRPEQSIAFLPLCFMRLIQAFLPCSTFLLSHAFFVFPPPRRIGSSALNFQSLSFFVKMPPFRALNRRRFKISTNYQQNSERTATSIYRMRVRFFSEIVFRACIFSLPQRTIRSQLLFLNFNISVFTEKPPYTASKDLTKNPRRHCRSNKFSENQATLFL